MRISVAVASCTGILGRANGDIVRATGRNEGASLARYPLSYGRQSCQRSTKTDPLLTQIRSIKSDPLFHLGMAPERRLSFNR